MRTSLSRLRGVAAWALLLIGCSAAGHANANTLTVDELQGIYALNTEAMPADPSGGDGFAMVSEMLEIDAKTLTFAPTFAGRGPFSLVGNTLTAGFDGGMTDVVQASLSDDGNVLTLVDEVFGSLETFVYRRRDGAGTSDEVSVATLQGSYELDPSKTRVAYFAFLDSGALEISGDTLVASLTFSETRSFALAGDTLTLTDADGNTSAVRARMSDDGNTLTLTFVEERDTFVYERR